MDSENKRGKGRKKSDKQEGTQKNETEQKNDEKQISLCVDCEFREVNKNTHKKNHWIISLQDLFKEVNPLLQGNGYLYVNKPYRSKVEELHTMITSCITQLTQLKEKLNLGSTPQQKLMEAIDEYNSKSTQDNLGNLIVTIQKSIKVTDKSESKSFFELLEGNEDSVCSFQQAEQILKDYDRILIETQAQIKQFTLYVEVKDKPLDFTISEQNINNLYKEIEGATSIKLKESWCSDDLEPLCTQLSKALQNNQTAQSLEINLSKQPLQEKGAEQIIKAIRYIKPLTNLSLNFNDCEIGNVTVKSIAKLIETNKQIKSMKLSLAYDIIIKQTIEYLSFISNNNIKHEGIKALSKSIATNKALDAFTLNLKILLNRNNKLSHDGAKQIMIGIGMNVSIKVLKVFLDFINSFFIQKRNNQLGNKGVEQIVEQLAKNSVAKNIELNLYINNEGVTFLKEGWIQLSQAYDIRVNLSKNLIDDNGAHALFQAIKENEYTKTFSVYLNDNKIKDDTSKVILTQIDEYLEIKKAKNPNRFNEAIIFSF